MNVYVGEKEFQKEHKRLIRILEKGSKEERREEAHRQKKELKRL